MAIGILYYLSDRYKPIEICICLPKLSGKTLLEYKCAGHNSKEDENRYQSMCETWAKQNAELFPRCKKIIAYADENDKQSIETRSLTYAKEQKVEVVNLYKEKTEEDYLDSIFFTLNPIILN